MPSKKPVGSSVDKTPETDKQTWNFENFEEAQDDQPSRVELYKEGCKLLLDAGFRLVPDVRNEDYLHTIQRLKHPVAVAGINYPPGFKTWQPLTTEVDIQYLQDCLASLPNNLLEFFFPLVDPDKRQSKPFYGVAKAIIRAEAAKLKSLTEVNPVENGITLEGTTGKARAWLPLKSWFDPQIQQLRVEDIITIFPEAELELLKIILGRSVVGENGSQTVDGLIRRDTFRSAAIIVGYDPGLGKSTVMERITKAMQLLGYSVETFGSVKARFNLASVALSDICYKDDTTSESLKSLLSAENTKIMVTGGLIRTEEKGVNAVNVRSRTVFIANSNILDPRMVYDMDSGLIDRVKLLTTHRVSELNFKQLKPGLAQDSPCLKAKEHLDWLSEKLNVSQEALMAWVLRCCADEYLGLLASGETGANPLYDRVTELSSLTKYQYYKNSTQVMCWGLIMAYMLRSNWFVGRLTSESTREEILGVASDKLMPKRFHEVANFDKFLANYAILNDTTADPDGLFEELVKKHWESKGKPDNHLYLAMQTVDYHTVLTAFLRNNSLINVNGGKSVYLDRSSYVKGVFQVIKQKDGMSYSHDLYWLTQSWDNCVDQVDELICQVVEIQILLKEGRRNAVDDTKWVTMATPLLNMSHCDPTMRSSDVAGNGLVDSLIPR